VTTDKELGEALRLVHALGTGPALAERIAGLEELLRGKKRDHAVSLFQDEAIDEGLLVAALLIKEASGQINTVLHAVGILASLPYIMKRGEVVESLSLGAGNTGKAHDLETSRQIAEFKFARWRGSDVIRQNNLFADVVGLACAETDKRRVLYVVDDEPAERFLRSGRAIKSVLKRHGSVRARLVDTYGKDVQTVGDFWRLIGGDVVLADLRCLVPALAK
jgi:hypothetical protein